MQELPRWAGGSKVHAFPTAQTGPSPGAAPIHQDRLTFSPHCIRVRAFHRRAVTDEGESRQDSRAQLAWTWDAAAAPTPWGGGSVRYGGGARFTNGTKRQSAARPWRS